MTKRKLLFVCHSNINRSRTAEDYVNSSLHSKYEAKSAGTFATLPWGNPITENLLNWADTIFVMDKEQENFIKYNNPQSFRKVINLNIPDIYSYGDKELVDIIKRRIR